MAFVKGSLSHAEPLLSDAEPAENISKDILGGDVTGDGAEMEDCFTEILSDKITG